MTRLPAPDLETDEGTLRSVSFDDIYYSPDDGLAETQHVFIDGNALPSRLNAHPKGQPFVIGELGFGTGLNVLAACASHEQFGHGPLHIWTVEGFPLSKTDFAATQTAIGKRWPELAPWTERLSDAYPDPVPGQTQITLNEGITLTIAFGEVETCLQQADFQADAWFLDGFAPSKNPQMWSQPVMNDVARLTQPGGTAATFSVASGVRSVLEEAGFSWEKAPGFGRKKHMLRAELDKPPANTRVLPWFRQPSLRSQDGVAIIGAGIAGASIARALLIQGFTPTIFGTGSRDTAASSNPAGLIMPRLDADDTPAARFYRDAFLDAVKLYRQLGEDVFSPCGGSLAIDTNRAAQIDEIGLWPDGYLAQDEGRLFVEAAGVLFPRLAADHLMGAAECIESRAVTLEQGDNWLVIDSDGTRHGPFSTVVLTTGAAQDLWPEAPIAPSLGQLDVFSGNPPPSVVTDGHYVAPYQDQVLTGATYARFEGGSVETTDENTDSNRQEATALLGRAPGEHVSSRAALRATTPDRHPIAGPLYDVNAAILAYEGLATGKKGDYPPAPYRDGLFALTGLGSRGLVTAPLLGAHIAALITGGVSPLTNDIAALVHPGRFLIRDIKRGKISP